MGVTGACFNRVGKMPIERLKMRVRQCRIEQEDDRSSCEGME